MSSTETTRVRTKKPADSAFKQQRLPAWQPILTAGTVLPSFFIVGIAFIPIGILLLHLSAGVGETALDYTFCTSLEQPTKNCSDLVLTNDTNTRCTCKVDFSLTTPLEGTVYMYYGLSNFYQNHRRYVKSRDDVQLLGRLSEEPSGDCAPFAKNKDGIAIAPCGAIANSLFNDELTITSATLGTIPLLRTGIAWPSDKQVKFRNPPGKDLKKAFEKYAKPPMWKKNVWELDLEIPDNNGFQNEDLIVWMRTAALPDFRKLYRRIDHTQNAALASGLPAGNYTLNIIYNFPVSEFEGKKKMILSTTSVLGGKNPFMGYAYIVTGCICLVLGIVFLIIHIKFGKSSSEVINVNPQSSYQ